MVAPCDVVVLDGVFRITPRGWHKFLSLKRSLEIPLGAIEQVDVRPATIPEEMEHFGLTEFKAGSRLGKHYKAGTFRPWKTVNGRRLTTWWLVRHADETIMITLSGFKYDRVIIEVDDPDSVAEMLRIHSGKETAR